MLELDANVGRIMDTIRAEAPDTIVILTCDNGAWQDAWPDAGVTPFRGEKGSSIRRRLPRARDHVVARQDSGRRRSRPDDVAYGRVADNRRDGGLTPPPTGKWVGNDGQPIYFDGIDNSGYVTGKSPTSARNSFVYIDGEAFGGIRVDIGGDPDNPNLKIAWKYLWTAKDTWLGPEQILGGIGAALQPHHGSVREIRHDVQWRRVLSPGIQLAGQVFRPGQRLGLGAHISGSGRVRQINHRISKHPPIPRWGIERPAPQSAGPVEPGASDGSEKPTADRRFRRLTSSCPGRRP